MRDLVILFVHVMATIARLWGPGGVRSVVAESVLVKQQLLILNRSRHPDASRLLLRQRIRWEIYITTNNSGSTCLGRNRSHSNKFTPCPLFSLFCKNSRDQVFIKGQSRR